MTRGKTNEDRCLVFVVTDNADKIPLQWQTKTWSHAVGFSLKWRTNLKQWPCLTCIINGQINKPVPPLPAVCLQCNLIDCDRPEEIHQEKKREVKTVARQHTTSVRLQQLIQFSRFCLQGYGGKITFQAVQGSFLTQGCNSPSLPSPPPSPVTPPLSATMHLEFTDSD